MKVKIQQRSTYHKFTEIEIEVPKGVQVDDWILENEDLWSEEMDNAVSKTEYEFGVGSYEGMDSEDESEWRYECPDGYGGHL